MIYPKAWAVSTLRFKDNTSPPCLPSQTDNRSNAVPFITELENVKTSFYVTNSSQVSLSERWSKKNLNYGSLNDPWKKIIKSELYQMMLAFKTELFRSRSHC